MLTIAANEAKTRFGELLERVRRGPVGVMRHNRLSGVMVSTQDFEAMRVFYADRLAHTLGESARSAEQAGLTEETLEALPADES